MHELTLHEEVLLLALDDERGTIPLGSSYAFALGGAIIAELILGGHISIEQVRRSRLVIVSGGSRPADPLLDECLQLISRAKRRQSAQHWVTRFSRLPLRERIAQRLRQKGVLRKAEGRVLFVFRRTTWPTANAGPEIDLVARMRSAVLHDGEVDGRTAIIVGLASAAGLLKQYFDRAEMKQGKLRIKRIMAGEDVVVATRGAIEAVQAAMIATTAAVTAATTAASS